MFTSEKDGFGWILRPEAGTRGSSFLRESTALCGAAPDRFLWSRRCNFHARSKRFWRIFQYRSHASLESLS